MISGGKNMSVKSVRELFKEAGLEGLVLYNETVSDTVENAAALLKCQPAQIAKPCHLL